MLALSVHYVAPLRLLLPCRLAPSILTVLPVLVRDSSPLISFFPSL
jgi:hypothetical protein